jgi:hypothetical protein
MAVSAKTSAATALSPTDVDSMQALKAPFCAAAAKIDKNAVAAACSTSTTATSGLAGIGTTSTSIHTPELSIDAAGETTWFSAVAEDLNSLNGLIPAAVGKLALFSAAADPSSSETARSPFLLSPRSYLTENHF